MATFFSNQTIWYWGSTAYPVKGTLTGNVSRSGNTVTLSGMSLALSWPASAWGTYSVSFTVNGTTTSRSMSAYTSTFAVDSTSFSVTASQTSKSVSWSSSDGYSGSFTVTFASGTTAPSGGAVAFVSSTWNSITIKSSVSSWGTGYSGTPNLEQIVCDSSSTSSNWDTASQPRSVKQNATSSLSSTGTLTNATDDWHPTAGKVTIKGCLSYKIAMWGSTSVGSTKAFNNTTRYLPPSPLSSGTATVGEISNNQYPVTLSATGGSSSNNYSVTVTTYYRIKKSTDSSYGSWVSMGTGTPWTQKTATIQADPSTSYNVQFKQTYQSQDSTVYTAGFSTPGIPFTATAYGSVDGVAEKIEKLYGPVNKKSKKILKLYASVNGKSKLIYED